MFSTLPAELILSFFLFHCSLTILLISIDMSFVPLNSVDFGHCLFHTFSIPPPPLRSQPLPGLKRARSSGDEAFLEIVMRLAPHSLKGSLDDATLQSTMEALEVSWK